MSNETPIILHIYEDLSLSKLAHELDKDGVKIYSHAFAWKDNFIEDVNE